MNCRWGKGEAVRVEIETPKATGAGIQENICGKCRGGLATSRECQTWENRGVGYGEGVSSSVD